MPADETWTLGLRWEFAERMAFKVETTYLPEYQARSLQGNDEFGLSVVRMGVQTIF